MASRPSKPTPSDRADFFSEAAAWAKIGEGWRHLHGSFRELGYSVEWHDFTTETDLNWAQSFHPESVEICLNLAGSGTVQAGEAQLDLQPLTAGFYLQSDTQLSAVRAGGQRHQFVTIELSFEFLRRHLFAGEKGLHPQLSALQASKASPAVSETIRLVSEHQQMAMSLRNPPVYVDAQRLWYHAKALEVAAAFFFQPSEEASLFCQRQKRQNHERVQKVLAILKSDPAHAWSLEEIGRRAACSQYHLSRIFSQEMGKSIFQCLRDLRLERAAELLRAGELNVTQVALEVGYSSPSHFSAAFHTAFGCCPGLYPLATPTQAAAVKIQRTK